MDFLNTPAAFMLSTFVVRLAGVLVLLFGAWLVAAWTRRAATRGLERAGVDVTLQRFFAHLARYVVLTVAVLAALGIFGVETTSFAALIAAMGLAIGLAFQGSLSNFAAGVMLLTFRPFKAGDFIVAGGTAGTVNEIELFTTSLDTPDNRRLIVPNSTIFGGTIENISFHPVRRVDVSVGTAYAADVDRTRQVLEGVIAREEAKLADRTHQVVLGELGDSAVTWTLRVWVNAGDFWPVKERLTRNVK